VAGSAATEVMTRSGSSLGFVVVVVVDDVVVVVVVVVVEDRAKYSSEPTIRPTINSSRAPARS
jgi:hypothetical protein